MRCTNYVIQLQHTQLTYNIHNILMISTFPKQRLPLELVLVFLKTTKPNWRMLKKKNMVNQLLFASKKFLRELQESPRCENLSLRISF